MFLDRLRTLSAGTWVSFGFAVLWMACATHSSAQTSSAPATAAAAAPDLNPADRAKREADRVFQMILMHSDKPRKVAAPKEDAAAVATRTKPPARPTAKPDEAVARSGAEPANPAAAVAVATSEADRPALPSSTSTAAATPATAPPAPAVSQAPMESALVASVAPTPVAAAPEPAIETLVPLSRPEPQFAQSLLRSLRKGQVQVQFTVLPDGSVEAPSVVSSSSPKLNSSALAAVAQWRFAPLRTPQSAIVQLGFDID